MGRLVVGANLFARTRNVRTRCVMALQHMGHSSSLAPQASHAQKWPHGTKTTSIDASMQTTHSRVRRCACDAHDASAQC